MFIAGKIQDMFDAVIPDQSRRFLLRCPPDIELPEGAGSAARHQQGFQKTTRGEYVVSGSAEDTGYIYLTHPDGTIANVICPEFYDTEQKKMNHAGGFQITDDILVVGYERFQNRSSGTSKILFYDIRDIKNPQLLSHLTVSRDRAGSTAGAVALAPYRDVWLMLAANWGSKRLDFYFSNTADLREPSAYFDNAPKYYWSWEEKGFGYGSIDQEWEGYQNINLFTEKNAPDSPLFIGMHSDGNILEEPDWADLYQLLIDEHDVAVFKKGKKRFRRSDKGPRFRYGSGFFYNENDNRFGVYSCESQLSKDDTESRCDMWAPG